VLPAAAREDCGGRRSGADGRHDLPHDISFEASGGQAIRPLLLMLRTGAPRMDTVAATSSAGFPRRVLTGAPGTGLQPSPVAAAASRRAEVAFADLSARRIRAREHYAESATVQTQIAALCVARGTRPAVKATTDVGECVEFARRRLCLDASRDKETEPHGRSPAAVGDETRVVVMAWGPEAKTE
jgi:hypothetical protein